MKLGITRVCALGLAVGLVSGPSHAEDSRRDRSPFAARQGQEVVNGSYSCTGTVFTDEQRAQIYAGSYLSATSGIAVGLFPTGQTSTDVPADLDAMVKICDGHVAEVRAQVPPLCTLGPLVSERGEFGNGASVHVQFDFSCQGGRDQVVGVIGGFSRLSLVSALE